jgi:hypothetical protein
MLDWLVEDQRPRRSGKDRPLHRAQQVLRSELRRIAGDGEPALRQFPRDQLLMIIDVLVVGFAPRKQDWTASGIEGRQGRTDSSMSDHEVCVLNGRQPFGCGDDVSRADRQVADVRRAHLPQHLGIRPCHLRQG